MTRFRKLPPLMLALALATMTSHVHAAGFVPHEYTGAPYTFFLDTGDPANPNPWESATQQRVTGLVTIVTALLPGGTGKDVPFGNYTHAVHDFSFFDGVFHWGPDDPFIVHHSFAFATDERGQLSSWNFEIFQNPPDLRIGMGGDIIEHMMLVQSGLIDGVFVRSDMPGEFAIIPGPAALPLMFTALAGLGWVGFRRARGLPGGTNGAASRV